MVTLVTVIVSVPSPASMLMLVGFWRSREKVIGFAPVRTMLT